MKASGDDRWIVFAPTIPSTWLDTVSSIPQGRVSPSLPFVLGFGKTVNEHLNLISVDFRGDRTKFEGAQSMPVRRPRKTHYVGYVPSLAPSAISFSDLELPSWEGKPRSPHSAWARVTSLKASESEPHSSSSTHVCTLSVRHNRPASTSIGHHRHTLTHTDSLCKVFHKQRPRTSRGIYISRPRLSLH